MIQTSVRLRTGGRDRDRVRVRVRDRVRVSVRVRDWVRGGGLLPTTSHSIFYSSVGQIAKISH